MKTDTRYPKWDTEKAEARRICILKRVQAILHNDDSYSKFAPFYEIFG